MRSQFATASFFRFKTFYTEVFHISGLNGICSFNKTFHMQLTVIKNKIYEVRGFSVMLDFDLAVLYGTGTKRINEQVKRNRSRFPHEFMFRLTKNEWEYLKSQFVVLPNNEKNMRSQNATAYQKRRNTDTTPFAFTEHGVAMLASVLKSRKAVKTNISIIKAFIALRQFALNCKNLADQIEEIRNNVKNHDQQLKLIHRAVRRLQYKKVIQQSWKDRERIGFKN
jgi:hypothetical protein